MLKLIMLIWFIYLIIKMIYFVVRAQHCMAISRLFWFPTGLKDSCSLEPSKAETAGIQWQWVTVNRWCEGLLYSLQCLSSYLFSSASPLRPIIKFYLTAFIIGSAAKLALLHSNRWQLTSCSREQGRCNIYTGQIVFNNQLWLLGPKRVSRLNHLYILLL